MPACRRGLPSRRARAHAVRRGQELPPACASVSPTRPSSPRVSRHERRAVGRGRPRGVLDPQRPGRARPGRRRPHGPGRRGRRTGRRVRVRQDDAGAHAHRPGATGKWRGAVEREAARPLRARPEGAPTPRPARAAGSAGRAQPTAHRVRVGGRGSARAPAGREVGQERDRTRRRRSGVGRAAPSRDVVPPLPARALGRSATARPDRRRTRGAAVAADRRRAGLEPRRVDPRRDPGAAAQAARASSGSVCWW